LVEDAALADFVKDKQTQLLSVSGQHFQMSSAALVNGSRFFGQGEVNSASFVSSWLKRSSRVLGVLVKGNGRSTDRASSEAGRPFKDIVQVVSIEESNLAAAGEVTG